MHLRTKIAIFLGTLVAALMVAATPAQASPNWSTCPSYDRVCFFVNINGGGSRLDVFNSTGLCLNVSPFMNDAISSIDNAWNDADLRAYVYFHSNCSGSSMYVGGNDAVNLNCCGREWINDNISSVKVRCVDFFNQCYRGP